MPTLFSSFHLRDVTFKNRIAVSPMSQYRAVEGQANDWHLVHLGRFAMGGAALVYAEATAVTRDGRRTPGDLGLWDDSKIEPLRRAISLDRARRAISASNSLICPSSWLSKLIDLSRHSRATFGIALSPASTNETSLRILAAPCGATCPSSPW